jgi:hypothetical protein
MDDVLHYENALKQHYLTLIQTKGTHFHQLIIDELAASLPDVFSSQQQVFCIRLMVQLIDVFFCYCLSFIVCRLLLLFVLFVVCCLCCLLFVVCVVCCLLFVLFVVCCLSSLLGTNVQWCWVAVCMMYYKP